MREQKRWPRSSSVVSLSALLSFILVDHMGVTDHIFDLIHSLLINGTREKMTLYPGTKWAGPCENAASWLFALAGSSE